MAKFRYYITDTTDGIIVGTDNPDVAHDCSLCEECFVLDSETGEWLGIEGDRLDIEEA